MFQNEVVVIFLFFLISTYIHSLFEEDATCDTSFPSLFTSKDEGISTFLSLSSSSDMNEKTKSETEEASVAGKKNSFETLYSFLQSQVTNVDPRTKYKFGRVIGKGSKGVVIEVINRSSKKKFAAKILKMDMRRNVAHALRDVLFLRRLSSVVWVPSSLIEQLVVGETLRNLSPNLLSEQMAKRVLFQIISMADFLQRNKICHNDLSLSNVMIDRPSRRLFLIDFADSAMIGPDNSTKSSSALNITFKEKILKNMFMISNLKESTIVKSYESLITLEKDCKDAFKLKHLVDNWIEKTHLTVGIRQLKQILAQHVKKRSSLSNTLSLPIFSGVSLSSYIELRGNRRHNHSKK